MMTYLQTPDLRIHYRAAGFGSIPVVLVHGNFASSRWWEPVLNRLPPGIVAYAPDIRGYGLTEKTVSGYSIPQLTSDLRGFVDAMDLQTFHLAGQSLGGAIALQFALDFSHRVRSLLLMAPAPATGLEAMRNGGSHLASALRLIDPEPFPSRLTLYALLRIGSLYGLNRVILRRALEQMMPNAELVSDEFEHLLSDANNVSPAATGRLLSGAQSMGRSGPTAGASGTNRYLMGARGYCGTP